MEKFRCPVCDSKYTQKDSHSNHLKKHDPNWENKEKETYLCIQCVNQYTNKDSMRNQIRNTHKCGPKWVTAKFAKKNTISIYIQEPTNVIASYGTKSL